MSMNHLDHFPKRDKNHVIESSAETAFDALLSRSGNFILQVKDRKDYGTDCQIEVVDHDDVTNIRIHVQLKGTKKRANANGSISIKIRRSNLNYLLMHPYSFFVCYHIPSDKLLFCPAESVVHRYEHSNQNWSQQQEITVIFSEILTEGRLNDFATLAKVSARSSRNMRVKQVTSRPEDLPSIFKAVQPDLHVPLEKIQAAKMLENLYSSGLNELISSQFEKFISVLGSDHSAMIFCHMAEINLVMDRKIGNSRRIEDGIAYLMEKLNTGQWTISSLHYSIGNGFLALGRQKDAIISYEAALKNIDETSANSLLAMCYKNLGACWQELGNMDKAVYYYREALLHDPQLPEAHYALGLYCSNNGEYREALEHLDQVVFLDRISGKQPSISGWRINTLFNLNDDKAAFREINILLSEAESEEWIWPWCARQVSSFGRTSPENARQSILFWDRYLKEHPNCPAGLAERLFCKFYLRSSGFLPKLNYWEFKIEFEASVKNLSVDVVARLWDGLGHWAQENENWEEAEYCFRIAYDLDHGCYGYCLGTALNMLDRPQESLPILLQQAEKIQPDDMSWFQVAVAYEKLGQVKKSVKAYQKVIELNPHNDLAWFNLGGVHWNAGNLKEAVQIWKTALKRFPRHELAAQIRCNIPFVFS